MHCLVVDPNLAFATLLSEELVRLGHSVTTCASGAAAVAAAGAPQATVQLALLDMGLRSPDALALGHQLRAVSPAVRLVLIPMMGEEPLLGAEAPVIQGVLPKPFFLPELGARIDAALATSPNQAAAPFVAGGALPDFAVSQPAGMDDAPGAPDFGGGGWNGALGDTSPGPRSAAEPLPVAAGGDLSWLDAFVDPPGGRIALSQAPEPSRPKGKAGAAGSPPAPRARGVQTISRRVLRANQEEILRVMRDLVNEAGADAVLLTSESGVLASAGRLDEAEILSISAAVLDSRRASEAVARVLGREQVRFEQSITGGSYVLYALDIQDAVLAVTVTGSASLGLLRHHARSAGERIAVLCSGA